MKMRGAVSFLVAGPMALLAACGPVDDVGSDTSHAVGTHIASLQVGDGRSVSFHEVADHGIVTVLKGPWGTPLFDAAGLESKSPAELYRALTGQEPPPELVAASQRLADAAVTRSPADKAPDTGPETTQGGPGGVVALGVPNTSWFVSNYCTGLGSDYDSMWCPTSSYIWAHSGWGPVEKFYMTCGTTSDYSGTLWMDIWNGAWTRIQTVNLPPWYVGCAWGWGRGQYRSGIDSTGIVLFSERYRYSIPSITSFLGDLPRDRSYENFSDDIQGITHDADNWYLTRNQTNYWKDTAINGIIAKQAMTDINSDPPIRYRMPDPWYAAGFRHYGDLVYANGLIYNSMDDNGDVAGVGVWNTNLNYIGFNYVPGWRGSFPFIAYNPRDGLFYTVTNAWGNTTLKAYQITVYGNTVTITERRSLQLMSNIPSSAWIQGGKVSAHGNLYVTVGGGDGPAGVYMIDVVNGFVQTFYGITMNNIDELEGLDLWDLDADQRLGAWGQIHFQKLDIDWPGFADDYWLAHYRVDNPSHL